MESNQRLCNMCGTIVTHADTKSAKKAIDKPCKECMYKTRKTPAAASCPKCEFTTKRLTSFEVHLKEAHSSTSQKEWDIMHGGPTLCKCRCGKQTTWISWHVGYSDMLKGHNGNIYNVYDQQVARSVSEKRSASLLGHTSWSKGLTKETDDRVANRAVATSLGRRKAFESGTTVAWNKGLTKETDDRIANIASDLASRYASGDLKPWAKGLNKDTDPRIKIMADRVAITHMNKALREKLDASKRLAYNDIKIRIEQHGTLELLMPNSDDYVNDNVPNIHVKCKRCDVEFNSSLRRLQHGRCFNCDASGSVAQSQVFEFIKSLSVSVDTCRRDVLKGLELDVYVPSRRFAIEYNGLYWHSLINKSSIYHEHKTTVAREQGIDLLHVFEDEWRDKRTLIEGMIKHRLGIDVRKIDARKCKIKQLSRSERRSFFDANHIDGDVNATTAFGLTTVEGELIACMSLRRPFHTKHRNSLEIARACCLSGTNVRGWLGRLTKACITHAKSAGVHSLMSYVDTRLGSTGKSWELVGWKCVSETSPRFWWTDFDNRFNRFKFKADKERGLTEAQVAEEADVVKIFGCKNLVYVLLVDQPTPSSSTREPMTL